VQGEQADILLDLWRAHFQQELRAAHPRRLTCQTMVMNG
jgi:hypothetical protein